MKNFYQYFLILILVAYSCSKQETRIIEIPMPAQEDIPMDYLEKSLFLGWSQNDYSVFYYLKEFSGYESDIYTIKLLSQNAVNDEIKVIKEFTSDYGDEDRFTYLGDFLEKKNSELNALLDDIGISLHDADIETERKIIKDDLEWTINIDNQYIDDSKRFNTKVIVNKPDGTKKTIYSNNNNSRQYLDMKYLGFILNPSEDNAVVIAYTKSESHERASLYSPIYIGCKLNAINIQMSSSSSSSNNNEEWKSLEGTPFHFENFIGSRKLYGQDLIKLFQNHSFFNGPRNQYMNSYPYVSVDSQSKFIINVEFRKGGGDYYGGLYLSQNSEYVYSPLKCDFYSNEPMVYFFPIQEEGKPFKIKIIRDEDGTKYEYEVAGRCSNYCKLGCSNSY